MSMSGIQGQIYWNKGGDIDRVGRSNLDYGKSKKRNTELEKSIKKDYSK